MADIIDVVGVGFGPANLALAIAITEHNEACTPGSRISARFLERQSEFGWHRGMLIDGATLQVSFLKDLATMRNPTSDFGFLSYLQARGRLVDFINHKSLFPTRVEFHDYLEWAAARLDHLVSYGSDVVEIVPVIEHGQIDYFDIRMRGGDVVRARNVVLGLGLAPRVPSGVQLSDRIWHNHDLLRRLEKLPSAVHDRFTVVGAGQSAAEVVDYLHREFPHAEVCAIFSRYGYSPADDSAFANRIFDPAAVDEFFSAPEAVKNSIMGYHRNTNYSVVDLELIDELYRRSYQEKVVGRERLRILNTSRIVAESSTVDGVDITVEHLPTGRRRELSSDVLIYATGYQPADPFAVLGSLGPYCATDEAGRLKVHRDYQVETAPELRAGIYLQGGTEHSHGISSSLLSNAAIRAQDILSSLVSQSVMRELVS